MKQSESLSNISQISEFQRPLPGFKIEVASPRTGWQKFIETTLSGRLRVHMVKKR